LKSALEINHGKVSNPALRGKISDSSLRSSRAESLTFNKNISQPSFIEVLDEDIEPTILSKDKKKHHQSGLLYSNKGGGDIEIDGLRNYLKVGLIEFHNPFARIDFFVKIKNEFFFLLRRILNDVIRFPKKITISNTETHS
jgi:hypothetical protein